MLKPYERYLGIILLFGVALLTTLDLVSDIDEGVDTRHAFIEGLIIALCLTGILFFLNLIRKQKTLLKSSLDQAREDLNYWKKRSSNFINGLGVEIEKQFESWNLSKSEKEIALLLIKGFSSREIAEVRKTSEKTVRVQTSSIYKKANLANRNELAAFFLEDLLLPQEG